MTRHPLSTTLALEIWHTPATGHRLALVRSAGGLVTFTRDEARALQKALGEVLKRGEDESTSGDHESRQQ